MTEPSESVKGSGNCAFAYISGESEKEPGASFFMSDVCVPNGNAKMILLSGNSRFPVVIAGARSVSPVTSTAVSQTFV